LATPRRRRAYHPVLGLCCQRIQSHATHADLLALIHNPSRAFVSDGRVSQAEWIAPIDRIPARIPIRVEPTRQPNRVGLREPTGFLMSTARSATRNPLLAPPGRSARWSRKRDPSRRLSESRAGRVFRAPGCNLAHPQNAADTRTGDIALCPRGNWLAISACVWRPLRRREGRRRPDRRFA
jgi:hypothetical protein